MATIATEEESFGLPVTVETGRLYTSELAPLLQRYGAARTVPGPEMPTEREQSASPTP